MNAKHTSPLGAPSVIAVDGPAASGKSSVGYDLAQRLGYLFFDTGAMYRAVALAALEHNIDPADANAVSDLAETLHIDISPPTPQQDDGRQSTVLLEGRDVTWPVRTPAVDRSVSAVAAHERVRRALTQQQRRIGERFLRANHRVSSVSSAATADAASKAGIVIVGRDVGTVVLPDAPLKIYLDATAEERARRRLLDMQRRNDSATFDEVLADIQRRDQLDSGRKLAPLRVADDAHVIDTTTLTQEQVMQRVLSLAHGVAETAINS